MWAASAIQGTSALHTTRSPLAHPLQYKLEEKPRIGLGRGCAVIAAADTEAEVGAPPQQQVTQERRHQPSCREERAPMLETAAYVSHAEAAT